MKAATRQSYDPCATLCHHFARIDVTTLKGIAAYATHARQLGYTDPEVDKITHEALYLTLTNSNFNLQEHLDMAMKVGNAS